MSKLLILFSIVFIYGIYAVFATGPVFGFYLYQLIYFLNPNDRHWIGSLSNVSFSFITVLLMFSSFLLYKKTLQKNKIGDVPEAKWILAMVIYYILVSFIAVDSSIHITYLTGYLKLLLIMYIAFRMIDSHKKLELALFAYIIGCAYIGYEAFSVGRNDIGRVGNIGTVDAPGENNIAASIIPSIPLLIYFIWHKPLKIKLFLVVLSILVINGIVLINSRGAMIGTAMGVGYLFFFMIFSRFKLPKQRLIVVLLIVLSSLTIWRFTDNLFWERMGTFQEEAQVSDTNDDNGRINFWLKTFDMLEDHPMGLGIWGYQILSPVYLSENQMEAARQEGWSGRAVHSMWFQGLSELGWIGFTFFILLLKAMYQQMKLAKKEALNQSKVEIYYLLIALQSAMICFLVAGSFIDAFRLEVFYWLILFTICACNITLNEQPDNKDAPR